jgi:hypothetical protein
MAPTYLEGLKIEEVSKTRRRRNHPLQNQLLNHRQKLELRFRHFFR